MNSHEGEGEVEFTISDEPNRVSALDHDGIEICGAYHPSGQSCWNLYVTQLVRDATHLPAPPHHEHFWGEHGHEDSRAWVELIAALYTRAA
jgi:hypothetical protein